MPQLSLECHPGRRYNPRQRVKPRSDLGLRMPRSVVPIRDDARELSASLMHETSTFQYSSRIIARDTCRPLAMDCQDYDSRWLQNALYLDQPHVLHPLIEVRERRPLHRSVLPDSFPLATGAFIRTRNRNQERWRRRARGA